MCALREALGDIGRIRMYAYYSLLLYRIHLLLLLLLLVFIVII